jgi:hypothetical protein
MTGHRIGQGRSLLPTRARPWPHGRWSRIVAGLVVVLPLVLCVGAAACDKGDDGGVDDKTTLATGQGGSDAEDIEGHVGEAIAVGDAIVTVRALQAAFQPAMPTQRLSDETPTAPATGESFYQAYVRVENTGDTPLRVDAEEFVCAVGTAVVKIEPTRSGPTARSLIKGTSLDLLLTFKAEAGYEPVLIYTPSWYEGTIRVNPEVEATTTTS